MNPGVENPCNGRVWDLLAEERLDAGDFAGALQAYEKVLRYGVYDGERISTFPGVTSYLIACCQVGLGDHDAAIDALAEAMRAGFVHVDRVLEDPRMEPLREDPRFDDVLGLVRVEGLSRDEGWRADLSMVVREARRRRPFPFDLELAHRFDSESARLDDDILGLTDAQIVTRLMRLLAMLRDGHASLDAPAGHESLSFALPVSFYRFEEGLFVTSATADHKALLGSDVLAFDGRTVDEMLEAIDPLLCRDNERGPLETAPKLLRKTPLLHALGLIESPHKVILMTGSGQVEVAAEAGESPRSQHFPVSKTMVHLHEGSGDRPLYLRNPDAAYWFTYLPEHRVVYFQLNQIADDPDEPMADFADRLTDFVEANDVDRLVIDLRWNGGGNTFLTAPLLKRIVGCRRIDRPGGMYLIVGRRTFSAAGNTAKYLEWLAGPNLTIVGEPTGSSLQFIGETVPFDLPYSGLRCNISNLYWQGMTPLDRRSWIPPDLYTPPTFAAYQEGRDPAMEAILAQR